MAADYLHPTARGYAALAEEMEPTLRKLLGESAP
jgi:lysophospholipase L1-like esterase